MADKTRQRHQVVTFHKRPKVAVVVFGILIIYVICFLVMYLTRRKVDIYQVESGSVAYKASLTGIAVREETVYNSSYSGTVNFYQHEGNRVKTGETVYTVDETGRISELLNDYLKAEGSSLTASNLEDMQRLLIDYKANYDKEGFGSVYTLQDSLNSIVLSSVSKQLQSELSTVLEREGGGQFQTVNSDAAGYVLYNVDGYEGVNADTFTAADFDKTNLKSSPVRNSDVINAGDSVYKLVTSENWYLLVPLSDEDIASNRLQNKKAVTVKFKKDNITTKANFTIINRNGKNYGKITMDKYMIRYITERFLDVELVTNTQTGMKVPNTAVTESTFYKIPSDYVMTGGNSNSKGFLVESYDSTGKSIQEFNSVKIYREANGFVYVKESDLTKGTNLIKPNSGSRFVVAETERLQGVYCVNTGYTVFKLLDVLDKNNEYTISRTGSANCVSNFDRIILDAEKFTEDQIVY